jgi:hypothetical protein
VIKIPKPGKNEKRKDFISRCIPIVIHEGTTDDPKQAAAICHSIWRKHHPGAKSEEKAERHSGIQSLRFDKKKFNRSQAVSWAKSHGFKSGDIEEMPNEWRLRQFDPKKCLRSGGMKDLDTGVRGYICPTASTIKSALEDLKQELEVIKKTLK